MLLAAILITSQWPQFRDVSKGEKTFRTYRFTIENSSITVHCRALTLLWKFRRATMRHCAADALFTCYEYNGDASCCCIGACYRKEKRENRKPRLKLRASLSFPPSSLRRCLIRLKPFIVRVSIYNQLNSEKSELCILIELDILIRLLIWGSLPCIILYRDLNFN